MNHKYLILFILSIVITVCGFAQEAFNEGTIVYKVTIDPPANQEGLQQHVGIYTIVTKNGQVKKELKLDNGFVMTILVDASKNESYSLRKIGNDFYAVQLNERAEHNKKYSDYKIRDGFEKTKLAGYEGNRATVIYKDGSAAEIFYTRSLKPFEYLFDWFPGIEGLPLTFEKKNDDGMLMHFMIESIATSPIESHVFKLPKEYKIISNEEYKKLMK